MRLRRLKSLLIFSIAMGVVLAAGIVLRNVILRQIRTRVEATIHYAKLRLTAIPPAIILEDVRSASTSPFFAAEKIVLRISFRSIFRRDRPLKVLVEKPVLRIYAGAGGNREAGPPAPALRLPFSVESGILRDGEFNYWGKGISFVAGGVRASFRQTAGAFVLRAECDEQRLLMDALPSPLPGKASLVLEGRENELLLRRLTVQGPDFLIKANGRMAGPGLKDPRIEADFFFRGPVPLLAETLDLPFRWRGTAEGTGRVVREPGRPAKTTANLASDDLVLNDLPLGRVAAGLVLDGLLGGRIDVQVRKRGAAVEYVDIAFGPDRIQGDVRGVHLDPVMREAGIPWPIRSPAWGRFSVARQNLEAELEFRDDLLLEDPLREPVRGKVAFNWDGDRRVSFTSERLETDFGAIAFDGGLVLDGEVKVEVRGDVTDVRKALDFVFRVLPEPQDFPDIRGRGAVGVKILGSSAAPEVKIDFALAPAGLDAYDVAQAGGLVELAGDRLSGLIKIRDPDFQADARLDVFPGGLDVVLSDASAKLERVLPELGIDLPAKGRASGRFEVRDRGKGPEVSGDFASPNVEFAGQKLRSVGGRLEYSVEKDVLRITRFVAGLEKGKVEGALDLSSRNRDFVLDLSASGLDLSAYAPKLLGTASFNLTGRGNLDRDKASGGLSVRGLQYGTSGPADLSGSFKVGFANGVFEAAITAKITAPRIDVDLLFRYPEAEGAWFLSAKGNVFEPDRLLPWPGAKGEIRYLAEVRGGPERPAQVNGVVEFTGSVFPIPDFAHALTDFSGLAVVQNNRATIRSFQAKLGGGDVFGSGEIRFGRGGVESLDIRADGRDMILSLFERTRAQADGSFRLLKDGAGFSLSGDVDVRKLSWRREIEEKLAFAASAYPESERPPSIFDDLDLDIRLRAEDNVVIENSLGRIEGRFDLNIVGTLRDPIILGDIEGLRGTIEFQDRSFRVLRARLSFLSPVSPEPYLDFRGETYLKDYRVTFSLSGLPSKLRPEFLSSPPLPPEDILALLALGESFKRTYSSDASAGVGTGALISSQLTDEAIKRAEKLFSLDRFRIDPFILGASTEMTARLTVGKKITQDIFLLYSTNLTSQREEIVRLEWEFSDSFSLVAMRDDRGRLSLDAKIRRRF